MSCIIKLAPHQKLEECFLIPTKLPFANSTYTKQSCSSSARKRYVRLSETEWPCPPVHHLLGSAGWQPPHSTQPLLTASLTKLLGEAEESCFWLS